MNTDSGYNVHFIFRRVSPRMRADLLVFWEKNRPYWVETTRQTQAKHTFNVSEIPRARLSTLLTNVACVALTNTGSIAGAAWIKVATMPVDTSKAQLIYFQRMYIAPAHRSARLANTLLNTFHKNLKECNRRSPLIKYLLAENANPKLKTPATRRLFIRKGFVFMGFNSLGNEVWKLALPPTSSPSINPVIR